MSAFINPFARKPRIGVPEAVARIKAQTRQVLGLSDEVAISVSELACRDPGCADVETVVGILVMGEAPRIVKIHKPLLDVTASELADGLAALPKPGAQTSG